MRRWLVAAAALISAAAVTAGLLWYQRPDAGASSYYVLARDLPAGAPVTLDALRLETMRLGAAGAAALPPGQRDLGALRATHDLAAGQLLQRADVAPPGAERRRVFIALRGLPPLAAGDAVDLLLVTSAADRTAVVPFAAGLRVQAASSDGLVVLATPDQASALIYAAATQHLVAVGGLGAGGSEPAVTSLDEAEAAARR
jgi:hypothetical protein